MSGAASVTPPVVGRGRDNYYFSSRSTLPSSDVGSFPGASCGRATHRHSPRSPVETRPGLSAGIVSDEAVSPSVRQPRTSPLLLVADRCPEARRMLGFEDDLLRVTAPPPSTIHRPFQVVTPFICPVRQRGPPPGFGGRNRLVNYMNPAVVPGEVVPLIPPRTVPLLEFADCSAQVQRAADRDHNSFSVRSLATSRHPVAEILPIMRPPPPPRPRRRVDVWAWL